MIRRLIGIAVVAASVALPAKEAVDVTTVPVLLVRVRVRPVLVTWRRGWLLLVSLLMILRTVTGRQRTLLIDWIGYCRSNSRRSPLPL